MTKSILRKYAKLIVKMGVNIKKGQGAVILADTAQSEIALMVAEEAYRAGAKWVDVRWTNQDLDKMRYKKESVKVLSATQEWEKARMQYELDELPVRIWIDSDDPDGLKGVNVEKMQKANLARMKVRKPYRDAMENKYQWTIVAVPSAKWAKKVFPNDRTSVAVKKLWDAILQTVRVSKDNDPVEAWKAHNASLKARYEKLNACHFESLHYFSENGTDFTCGLIPDAQWMGGGETLLDGTFFNPNMPTEEIFTSPMKGKAEGTVVSTMPLSYQGNLIENFSITFKGGRAVSCKAEKNQELLEHMIAMDEGAAQIGDAGDIHQRAQLGAVIQRGNEPPPGKESHRRHQHLRDAQHHAEQGAAGAVVPHQLHHAGHAQCTGKDSVLCKNSQQCIAEKHRRSAYNFLHGSRSASFW